MSFGLPPFDQSSIRGPDGQIPARKRWAETKSEKLVKQHFAFKQEQSVETSDSTRSIDSIDSSDDALSKRSAKSGKEILGKRKRDDSVDAEAPALKRQDRKTSPLDPVIAEIKTKMNTQDWATLFRSCDLAQQYK